MEDMMKSRPGNSILPSGGDLSKSINLMLANKSPVESQYPSLGCNIKWKVGNEPDYFNR